MSNVPPKRNLWISILLVVVAGLAAYSNSFESPFVFDDRVTIEESWNVRQLPDVVAAMGAPDGSCVSGRPLPALTLAVNFSSAKALTGNGLHTTGYHVFNVLAHLAAAVCLLLLARTVLVRVLGERSAGLVALAIAALWVVHPLHTAAIDHVSYRNETLLALFYLLTLLCAERALTAERPRWWIVGSALACGLGMASKEIMVSAPLIVLLWDRAVHASSFGDALRRHWRLHLSLAATWGVLAWCLVGADRGEFVGFGAQGVTGWSWMLTQTEVLLHYLRLVFWPSPLQLDASDWPIATGIGDVWPSALVVTALFVATLVATWRRKPLGVVTLMIFAVLAPTSSFIPITGATMAEHRMVLPLAGVLTLVVVGAYRLLIHVPGRVKGAAVVLAVVALGIVTFRRNADYHTVLGIWQDTIDKRPNNTRAYEHLCDQLKAAGRYDLAEAAYRRSLSIDPDQGKANYNLGMLLASTKRKAEAQTHFDRALATDPGITEEAFLVGWSWMLMGRTQAGARNMGASLTISPELAERPEHRHPCLQLAWICAVAREPELYDPTFSANLARRLIGLLREARTPKELTSRARAHDALAAALANLGKPREAVAAATEALADAQAAGRPKLAGEIQQRIRLFDSGRKVRVPVTRKPGRR